MNNKSHISCFYPNFAIPKPKKVFETWLPVKRTVHIDELLELHRCWGRSLRFILSYRWDLRETASMSSFLDLILEARRNAPSRSLVIAKR